jgi:aminoglycoside 3-N-acetyltransferase
VDEGSVVKASKHPNTVDTLIKDFRSIGLSPGITVLVHSSMSAIGWVCGGQVAVIQALCSVIRPYGTIVMPTHSGHFSDPANWENPPVPKSWWDTIRKTMPAYNPEMTPSRGMGSIPELFRTMSTVVRSEHPHVSFAAWGENNVSIVENHRLEYGLGPRSPLGKIYNLDGWVLLLGAGFDSNTSFHLAEYRAKTTKDSVTEYSAPVTIAGHRRWKTYTDIEYNSDDFLALGRSFLRNEKEHIWTGRIGNAKSFFFPQRCCVDFAVRWIEKQRH